MYDLAVIGGGPGGYVAAIRGAQHGLKTLLVERDNVGGTCLSRGCIPTKCLIHDTKLFHATKTSAFIKGSLSLDVSRMMERKRGVVRSLINGLGNVIKSHGIDVVNGSGELNAPGRLTVRAAGAPPEEYRARHVILSMGSKPSVPSFIRVDGDLVRTTDESLDSEKIPPAIIIVGGGVIGVEMASIYANMGCEVTILELLPDILASEDGQVKAAMKRLLEKRGVRIHVKARVEDVETKNDGVEAVFQESSGKTNRVRAGQLLVATGRAPVLDGVLPERLGLRMDGPFLKVNGRLETGVPGVWAIGDMVGGMMLAHKASAEAEAAVANITGGKAEVIGTRIPRCVWGVTEIGAVGLTEEEARASGRAVRVGAFSYGSSGAAQAMEGREGFTKIIGDAETGEILGVHIIGEHATDLIGEAVTAINAELAVEDLAEAIKPHPSLTENVMEAALDWSGLAVHSPRKR